ncbi:MAG: hypothetical protein WA190_14695 [Usitatibacter sp.]
MSIVLSLGFECRAASTIVPVGIVGNGGEAGETLFLVQGPAGLYSGCAVDDSATLWLSGGSAILRASIDGRVIGRFPLQPKGSYVDSTTFALVGNILYFVARDPRGEYSVFSLDTAHRNAATRVAGFPHLGPLTRDSIRISAQPRRGKLLVAYRAPGEAGIAIAELDPATGSLDLIGRLPGDRPESLVWDEERKTILLGGRVLADGSRFVPGISFASLDDTLAATKSIPTLYLVATPTSFIGRLSLAAGALWDVSASFGFIARFDKGFARDPGAVLRWKHEFDQTTQIAAVPAIAGGSAGKTLVVGTTQLGSNYLAQWSDGVLTAIGRIGSLPDIASLALSPGGQIGIGANGREFWWRWEDGSNSAPRMADLSIARGSGLFVKERFFAFGDIQSRNATGATVPLVFSGQPTARNAASRPTGEAPIASIRNPCCITLLETTALRLSVLALDSGAGALYRLDLEPSSLVPMANSIASVAIAGVRLSAPTSMVALADHRLLVADQGRILTFCPDGGGYKLESSWNNGNGPGGALGGRIFIAGEGDTIVVSDTERERVLWIDAKTREIRGQLGETGVAGSDLRHLSRPTFVAVAGDRAVVADAGNQRIVKLDLKP